MIRGFYYHHFKNILGDKVKVKTYWFSELTPLMRDTVATFNTVVIGKGKFIYQFVNSQQNPLHSVWLFQFYNAHWAGGYTIPPTENTSNEFKFLDK